MLTVRHNVFPMPTLSRALDEMFKAAWGEPGLFPGQGSASRPFPPLNAWEDDGAIYVEAELPGFKAEDLDISLSGRELTIRGTRQIELPEGAEAVMSERPSGRFERTVRLSVPVAADQVGASLREGVLTLKLPKTPEAQPRKIAVRTADAQNN